MVQERAKACMKSLQDGAKSIVLQHVGRIFHLQAVQETISCRPELVRGISGCSFDGSFPSPSFLGTCGSNSRRRPALQASPEGEPGLVPFQARNLDQERLGWRP